MHKVKSKKACLCFFTATLLLAAVGCGGKKEEEKGMERGGALVSTMPPEEALESSPVDSAAPTENLPSGAVASLTPDISVTPMEVPSETPVPPTPDVPASATDGEPIWAKGTQMDSALFQNLNLDGIGDADDEAYVSVYQFGDYHDRAIVLRIHLGTGETLAEIFPLDGFCTFQTGKLFSEDREAIILDIQNRTSNYSAATVFAIDVYPADVDPWPGTSVRLAVGAEATDELIPQIYWGTEVIDIEGSSLQGLEIPSLDPKDKRNEPIKNIFYWDKENRDWIQSVK